MNGVLTAHVGPRAGFRLDRRLSTAYFGGMPLDLDSAAYQVLEALLSADDAVLDEQTLGWGDEAGQLWDCVAKLNNALARCSPLAGHVANFPDQGYQLVRAPELHRRILGRGKELAQVAELLRVQRFVTIVGPGGMGKTTLARALAADCAARYPDGLRFVDLAALAEGRELYGVLGAALGIAQLTRETLAQLAPCLRGQRMLILLDCCEHHVDAAAHIGEALLRAAPGVDILCTSREPLLARGEQVFRLGPVGLPGPDAVPDAREATGFPAVALFVARAGIDNVAGFDLHDDNVVLVCEICRSLEGVPLALELAAAMVRQLGLERLALETSRCLLQSGSGPLHARDRHYSLSGMLDWSYDALTADEQHVLRWLAMFRGSFTLEAAGAVAAKGGLDADEVANTVIELASKSLVSMHPADGGCRPRLLDVTREYAFDKLVRSGELRAAQERHAGWLGALMHRLDDSWMELSRHAWLDMYGPWIDDILAAIDWALGVGQAPLLGAQLAGIGFSLADQIGVAREFQARIRRAFDAIAEVKDPPAPILLRLISVNSDGRELSAFSFSSLVADAEQCLQLARASGHPKLQGAPLIGLWGGPFVRGDYPASLPGAQQIAQVGQATGDMYLQLIGQRTMAQSLHFMGRHAEARPCAMRVLARSDIRIPLSYQPSPVQVGTSIRIVLARLLWMEGAADQAAAMSEEAIEWAQSDRPVALCQVLAMASIPVAIWRGETERAAGLVRRLRERAERHGMGYWSDWVQRFEEALAVMAGTADTASLPLFADTLDFSAKCRDHLATFSPRLLSGDAIFRCETGLVGWCAPELLRAQAVQRLASDALDRDHSAAALLRKSLALAEQQGALGWALRSATSLSALYRAQGADREARAILEPVLSRCHEGRDTADVRAARALMAALG